MRTVTYGAACSLDGYIAREDGSVDWLHWGADVERLTTTYWRDVDTVLMGRKTYEVGKALGSGAYTGVRNYLFSRTLSESPEPDIQLVDQDAAQFVAEMKASSGRGICVVGGGDLAQTLFAAGLVDQVGVNIQPLILGSGIPFFRPIPVSRRLELIRLERIDGGCVYVLYRVLH